MTPLSSALVSDTVAMITPALLALLAQPAVGRDGLALCIRAEGGLDLGDFTVGDLSRNSFPNDQIARQKCALSLRARCAGSQAPALMAREGDSEWTGSAYLEGLAVGCAGLTEEMDEMVAHWVATAIRARLLAAG